MTQQIEISSGNGSSVFPQSKKEERYAYIAIEKERDGATHKSRR